MKLASISAVVLRSIGFISFLIGLFLLCVPWLLPFLCPHFGEPVQIEGSIHDTYYVVGHYRAYFPVALPFMVAGVVLLVAGRPLGRLLCKGIDENS